MKQSIAEFIKQLEAQRQQVAVRTANRQQAIVNLSKVRAQLQKDFDKIFSK